MLESLPAFSDWTTQEYAQTLNQLLLEPVPQVFFVGGVTTGMSRKA